MKKQADDAAVLAALEAVDAAKQRVKQLQIELMAAGDDLGKAHGALKDARAAADAKLPTAKMEEFDWSGRKTTQIDMVITKRSAKSITVRYPGADPGTDAGYTFRDDGSGTWMQYPRPRSYGSKSRKLVVL